MTPHERMLAAFSPLSESHQEPQSRVKDDAPAPVAHDPNAFMAALRKHYAQHPQIGRASCRERV